LVDDHRAEARLQRLEEAIERLEAVRAGGKDAYLLDADLRARSERLLEVAIQVCIDLGAQVVAELSAPAPADYAAIFKILADKGLLPRDLGGRMADAARQRNLLIHLYLEIDDRAVFDALGHLDDLRQFAVFIKKRLD
jgi:uncharacterized protein YutE (UPF0331/DUF86 family)